MNTPAYLFLDIDGVLQTPALGDFLEMEHRPVLEAWLREHPQVRVVLTSTHREGLSLQALKGWFSPDVEEQLVGMTALTPTGRAYGGRQAEIEAWMNEHAAREARFCALDDETLLFRPDCAWLVHVHPWTGLLPEHLSRVEALLAVGVEGTAQAQDFVSQGRPFGAGRPLFTADDQALLRRGQVQRRKEAPAALAGGKAAPAPAKSWLERLFSWLD